MSDIPDQPHVAFRLKLDSHFEFSRNQGTYFKQLLKRQFFKKQGPNNFIEFEYQRNIQLFYSVFAYARKKYATAKSSLSTILSHLRHFTNHCKNFRKRLASLTIMHEIFYIFRFQHWKNLRNGVVNVAYSKITAYVIGFAIAKEFLHFLFKIPALRCQVHLITKIADETNGNDLAMERHSILCVSEF